MISKHFRKLQHRLRLLRPGDARQTFQDRLLAYRLHATFEKDLALMDVRGIRFYVRGAVVELSGTVGSVHDAELLKELVRQHHAVEDVVSKLCLKEPPIPVKSFHD